MDNSIKYYLKVNDQESGPFTFDELLENGLLPEALVRWEGMDNWAIASDVFELKPLLERLEPKQSSTWGQASASQPVSPPVSPPTSHSTIPCPLCGQEILSTARKCPYCGRSIVCKETGSDDKCNSQEPKKSCKKFYIMLVVSLLALALAGGAIWLFLRNDDNEEKKLGQFAMDVKIHDDDDIKEFVEQFTVAVANNDSHTILSMYPDANLADSLALQYDPEYVVIEKVGDHWKVSMGDEWKMMVVECVIGNMLYIKESSGVFAYPDSIVTLAKSTGWIDTTLNDVQNAERLSDTAFVSWLEDERQNKVQITKSISVEGPNQYNDPIVYGQRGIGDTYCTVVISNPTSHVIDGDAYVIYAKETCDYIESGNITYEYDSSYKTLTGKLIPARGTAIYTWKGMGWFYSGFGYMQDFRVQCKIELSPQLKQLGIEIYPTGKEYEDYKASH